MDKIFFDKSYVNRINLLAILLQATKEISVAQAERLLQVSKSTILMTVQNIDADIKKLKMNAEIKIMHQQIEFHADSNFGFNSIEQYYLEKSDIYKLLNLVFKDEYEGLRNTSLQLNRSLTSLYRKMDSLNLLLEEYGLKFVPNDVEPIQGDEMQIRLFMFRFFWASRRRKGAHPFSGENEETAKKVAAAMAKELQSAPPALMDRMTLWVEVILQRNDGGFYLDDMKESNLFDEVSGTLNFKKFKTELNGTDLSENDIFFLFIVMIGDPLYSDKNDYMTSILNFGRSERPTYEKMGLDFINVMNSTTMKTMDDKSFILLYRRFLSINLFAVAFNEKSIIFEDKIKQNQLLKTGQFRFGKFDQLYDLFFKKYPQYNKYKCDMVFQKYLKAVLLTLPKAYFFKTLNVKIMVNGDNDQIDKIKRVLDLVSPCPIVIVDVTEKECDLLITDLFTTEQSRLDQNIFVIADPLLDIDIVRLKNKVNNMI